ncbi:hypothetical protein QBC32DRAFT_2812 [Pseudoneurospora amorphoporcata]|uniref:BTB domain-containing protein n=1 Tax=Pseudoneurospora amorphoporcata TaxID=241081 RepID=A0AAN6P3F2_9PEZI|nr:hypothetical protein QBC32DRAFT_2812 [Pseudoneurospora amorphoporcata]
MMEKKSQTPRFQPLSYASALRGKLGAQVKVKPTSTPTPTSTPAPKTEVSLKPLAATFVPAKPTVQQPPPAVSNFKQAEHLNFALHTNSTTAPSRNKFPQLAQPVAQPRLAPTSYAQAVTGKRTTTLVIKKKEQQGPQAGPKKTEGEITVQKELGKGPQKSPEKNPDKISAKRPKKNPEKDPEKDPQKIPQNISRKNPEKKPQKNSEQGHQKSTEKDPQKGTEKSPEKSPRKSQKKSPKKKKKKENATPDASFPASDSTIKAQHIPQHQKASKKSQESEKKSAATTERGPTAPQGGGLTKESARSKNACINAALGEQNQGKKLYAEQRRGRSPVKASPCILNAPTKPKAAGWGGQNWRSPATIGPRQRSTTFPGVENPSHPFHNQSPTLTARYQLGQLPSTSFAPCFANNPQYNHHEPNLQPRHKGFLPTMRFLLHYGRPDRCRPLDPEQWPKAEGLCPKAIDQQKRIAEYIKQHDRKEIDLWHDPKDWDVMIECGDGKFFVHRQMLAREQSVLKKLSKVIPDGNFTRCVYPNTTPERMANVLAFIYDKSTMEGETFVPSPYRPLNGGIILNNVLAYLASIEVDFPLLRSVALANLQEAIQGVKTFFADLDDLMQDLVDEANEDGIPSSEWDLLTPTFVRDDDELENLYKPFRIALQALWDFHEYKPSKFWTEEAGPLREAVWRLALAIYNRLMLSKKFRNDEQPKWEQMRLMELLWEEEFFWEPQGLEWPEGFKWAEDTWDL